MVNLLAKFSLDNVFLYRRNTSFSCNSPSYTLIYLHTLLNTPSLMSQKSPLVEIELNKLEPGMFLVKLDISWLDSPFLRNALLIKSADDVKKLRKAGAKRVTIDISKGKAPTVKNEENTETSTVTNTPEVTEPLKPASLSDELSVAQKICGQIKAVASDLNARLEKDLPVDSEEISPLIRHTMDSLERNNQALLSLTQISRKSQKLADHSFSCFCLSLNIAQVLKLPEEEINALAIAALLHDTGWLQLPLKLMGKRGAYTATERKLVASHVDIGLKMLQSSNIPALSKRIIAEHHEQPDGGGYPKKLKSDAIHRTSKIFAVVEVYEELVHQLSDKPGMLPNNALRQIYVDGEKAMLDAEYVAALINILGIYPVTTAVQLDTGERAMIEEVKPAAHLRPVVLIHYDKNGHLLDPPLRIDLSETPPDGITRQIEGVIDPADPSKDPQQRLRPGQEYTA